jgi:hypothetical protein
MRAFIGAVALNRRRAQPHRRAASRAASKDFLRSESQMQTTLTGSPKAPWRATLGHGPPLANARHTDTCVAALPGWARPDAPVADINEAVFRAGAALALLDLRVRADVRAHVPFCRGMAAAPGVFGI